MKSYIVNADGLTAREKNPNDKEIDYSTWFRFEQNISTYPLTKQVEGGSVVECRLVWRKRVYNGVWETMVNQNDVYHESYQQKQFCQPIEQPKEENKNMETEIEFIKTLLPSHYEVKESNKKGSIHCVSQIGLRKLSYLSSKGNLINDDEDDESFNRFITTIKIKFGTRFQEVFHNTCFCHVDFTIYLKAK